MEARGTRRGARVRPVRDAISERFLHVRSLRFETRFLLGVVVAQLLMAAVLVFERNAHQPRIVSDNFAETSATISIVVLVFSIVFACVAWRLLGT